jgi:2-dehydropantoate 2-reductase
MSASSLRYALVGTGAVGCSLGSDMLEAGLDITFIDQWPEHVEAMKTQGLTINLESGSRTIPVEAKHLYEVAQTRGSFDVVFTAVKTYDTRWVMELMRPMMRDDSVFVGLQNGMTIDQSAELLGVERSIGCVLGIAANMPEPGVVNRETDQTQTWLSVGEVSGEMTDRLAMVHEALSHAARVEMTTDIRSAKWMKLLANIPEMLPSGILGLPLLDAAHTEGVREVMDEMSREAYALAIDLGITMQPTLGLSADQVPDSDQYAVDLLDVILESYSRPGTKVAVLQDWLKGRRAEIDAFSGYIVKKRTELGGDVPVNRAVVEIAQRIETGELTPSPDNLELFLSTLKEKASA